MSSEDNGQIFKEEEFTIFGLYAGSLAPLDKLDLSFLNLQFSKISSRKFKTYLDKTKHKTLPGRTINNFQEISKEEKKGYSKELFVLYPIDLSKPVDEDLYIEIQNAFLIMYPSDFRLYKLVGLQLFDKKYLFWNYDTTWDFHTTGKDHYDNFMWFKGKDAKETSAFLKIYFDRKSSIDYLKITTSSYINSFFQDYSHMAYIALCISLESITSGKSELIYRIRRNCAIINGDTIEKARTIFKNVDELYSLRSTIIHGDKFTYEKVEEYLPKLRALVSRTIIELFTFNIKNIDDLNRNLTEIGFGDKKGLVSKYKQFKLDYFTLVKVSRPVIIKQIATKGKQLKNK